MTLAPRLVRTAAASVALIFAVAAPLHVVAATPPAAGVVVATGDTTIDFFGSSRTMTFNVVQNPQTGDVQGHLEIEVQDTGTKILVDVESFYDTGTDLIIVGPITQSINAPGAVGDYLITSIRDGGNGGSADTITYANTFPFAFTAEDIVMNGLLLDFIIGNILGGYHPLTAGNVTIH